MTTNKPHKYDMKMRYVKTHAIEVDFPAAKDASPIFVSRLGEYRTTQELFLPGAVVLEIQKCLKNPLAYKAIRQIVEAVALIAMHSTPADIVGAVAGMVDKSVEPSVAEPSATDPVGSTVGASRRVAKTKKSSK